MPGEELCVSMAERYYPLVYWDMNPPQLLGAHPCCPIELILHFLCSVSYQNTQEQPRNKLNYIPLCLNNENTSSKHI